MLFAAPYFLEETQREVGRVSDIKKEDSVLLI